ncbi:hypothetical protein EAO27_16045 [Sphingopyxis sp. YF1]|jgi:hypothetical protein|uniref:hypothetical protein n=1 Tax=Sphingopyxis sp. YF1 TaxID=2482763 RepID=UPI001F61EDF9|nr:hypothetical protein [Sphingopyxis sp. YF1]UNU44071.1 hypothetical protein EAO27_16045 [Sphingopyxis sp. YF1]
MNKMLTAGAGLGAIALAATAATAQQAPKPKVEAVYWLSAETVSGMATGQPAGVEKNLLLQLGSVRRNPAPSAEHLPPQILGAGERLPLVTPAGAEPKVDGRADYRPGTAEQPKGRIELYWGCGETAPAGQPVVIDLAAMKAGGPSPFGTGPNVRAMTPPSTASHATYGEWPNGRKGTRVPRNASLAGDHVVQGNYSPDMRFTVAPANDFLAALAPRNAELASGAVKVSWPTLANARGLILTVTGARDDGTVVMWTSSAVRMPGMALPDYLEQSDIARLVQQRILLAPEATECVVPSAVGKATDSAMLMMTAFGPEANYGAPREAPAGWAVKLRTRATHMSMLGVDLAAMLAGSGDEGDSDAPASEAKPKKKRGLLRGIGSALGVPG